MAGLSFHETARHHQVAANRRRCLLLVATVVVVAAAGGTVAGAVVATSAAGAGLGLALAVLACALAWWRGDTIILRRCGARRADPGAYARLHNVVEGLCVAGGLPKPGLYVVAMAQADALAVGRSARRAALVVTTGLLDTMSRVELEGVLAHELLHVRNGDIAVSTLAATLVGPVTGGRLTGLAVGRQRELLADVTGVALTRYPPGLAAALEKVRDGGDNPPAWSRTTAALGIASAPPPLDDRIVALREL